jgi:hypothetical protein
MTRFGEYYRRSLRAGYGYLEVGLRYKSGPGKLLLKRARSSFLYFAFLPLLMVALAFIWWPLGFLPLLLYARVLLQMTLWARRRGAKLGTAAAYAALNLVCKAASMWGGIRFLVDRMSGRGKPRDELIVYRKS